ncbi:MAG TPA: response regulator [Myxococcales bacterium]|jgi:CheY-like chemotaxis protein|nr:response regulator [Myxococcales bacterium]
MAVHASHSILLVDDDPEILEMTEALFSLEGYAVTTAQNGLVALGKLDGGLRPCVVLLDLMMPQMNGYQFMEELRARELVDEVPVLVFTAAAVRTPPTGALMVLEKPLDVEGLVKTVASVCEKG